MISGITSLFVWRIAYCQFAIARAECKWWEFGKKRAFQEQLDYFYPLMKAEQRMGTKST